jgi:flagellar biosynthesis/type III secretory pathway protein FliH
MALIKNSNSVLLARDAIVLDLGDLRRQADHILEQARLEAARIIGDAQRTRQRMIESAASEGRAEGLAEGLARGHAQGVQQGQAAAHAERREVLNTLQSAWSGELRAFVERREAMLDEAKKDLIALAAMIARRITHRAIELDASIVREQIEGVLTMVMRQSRLTVRVHPLDREVTEAAMPEFAATYSAATDAQIVEDPSLPRGSCVVRLADLGEEGEANGAGTLDASIGTQLDRIVEALLPGGSRFASTMESRAHGAPARP